VLRKNRKAFVAIGFVFLGALLITFFMVIGRSETTSGWRKSKHNPVLGGELGTCFDVTVLKEGEKFRMWFSWRPSRSITLVESFDGIIWSYPLIVLKPNKETGWENRVNRPVVLKRDDEYHMWYTGQAHGRSYIGYAVSSDGKTWIRTSVKPVLVADAHWEKIAVMAPHVIWDQESQLYKMWYSGGGQIEPDAIGYATSRDYGDWFIMFYIGFENLHRAQIGIARSRDGITNWERHPRNPVICLGSFGQWDRHAVYKPSVIFDGKQWLLWYNGRAHGFEQIGMAIHEGPDLGFGESETKRNPARSHFDAKAKATAGIELLNLPPPS
jgi:hypothetical protein